MTVLGVTAQRHSASSSVTGVVVEFDEAAGMGVVKADNGEIWPFHCIEIADGSRSIKRGTRVEFHTEFRVLRREAVHLGKI